MTRTSRWAVGLVLAVVVVGVGLSPGVLHAERLAQHAPVELLTEAGEPINPVAGTNMDQPYSPRETCGQCHPYDTIVEGYHFQQGKSELSEDYDEKRPWILSPGSYGGF